MSDIRVTDFQAVDKVLQGINKQLDTTINKLVDVSKVAKGLGDNVASSGKKQNKAMSESEKLAKKLHQAKKNLSQSYTEEAKQLSLVREKLRQRNQEQRNENKLTLAQAKNNQVLKGSYDKINQSLNDNIRRFKSLTEQQRKNSKEGRMLVRNIQRTRPRIKKAG